MDRPRLFQWIGRVWGARPPLPPDLVLHILVPWLESELAQQRRPTPSGDALCTLPHALDEVMEMLLHALRDRAQTEKENGA